jgi:hypothetical protein
MNNEAKEKLSKHGIEMTDFISSSGYEAVKQLLENQLIERDRLLNALDGLLNKNEGSGCPMCDNGKLRNAGKEHWDDCVWNNARVEYEWVLAKKVEVIARQARVSGSLPPDGLVNVYENCYEALKTLIVDRWSADNVNKIQALDKKIIEAKQKYLGGNDH